MNFNVRHCHFHNQQPPPPPPPQQQQQQHHHHLHLHHIIIINNNYNYNYNYDYKSTIPQHRPQLFSTNIFLSQLFDRIRYNITRDPQVIPDILKTS
eukprot:768676-Hanusia_phi.AAC.5